MSCHPEIERPYFAGTLPKTGAVEKQANDLNSGTLPMTLKSNVCMGFSDLRPNVLQRPFYVPRTQASQRPAPIYKIGAGMWDTLVAWLKRALIAAVNIASAIFK
jgi:hypothetical protein